MCMCRAWSINNYHHISSHPLPQKFEDPYFLQALTIINSIQFLYAAAFVLHFKLSLKLLVHAVKVRNAVQMQQRTRIELWLK